MSLKNITNNATIKIIPAIKTPSRYENNKIKSNNSAFNLNPEYLIQNEKNPSPTLMLHSTNNKSNNINNEVYHVNNDESDIEENSSKNKYIIHRTNKTNSVKERYPSNYSYYESKYSKKDLKQENFKTNSEFTVKTHRVFTSNTHNNQYNSNEKRKIYNKEIPNSLLQSLNRSHLLSPNSFSKDEFNNYNNVSPMKKSSEIFYSKIPQNKINYFQKTAQNNTKKNRNIIIYKDYHKDTNEINKIIAPKTPKVYSQYKVVSHDPKYIVMNQTFQKNENKTQKNLNNINNKSVENIAFNNNLINYQNVNKKINNSYKQNNFKKVVKYSSKTDLSNNNIRDNSNIVQPFRLSGDNKNNKFNNNNNNINSTIVNITYINENKNYIKNIYSTDLLKPQVQDKFILDNENKESKTNLIKDNRYLQNDTRRTPNQGIKIINANANKIKVYTPMNNKIENDNYQYKTTEVKKIQNQTKNENNYMNELKSIMYNNRNNNSRQINQYNNRTYKDTKGSFSNDKIVQNKKNELTNDTIKKNDQNININNISLNIRKKKDKSEERDYQLSYNAKITETKYRKKSQENPLSNINLQKTNPFNNINTKSYYPSTSSKITSAKTNTKSFFNSNNKTNEQNNQNLKNNNIVSPISNLSKLTISNTSSRKTKTKPIIISREEKKGTIDNNINNNNDRNMKINPFRSQEIEKRKKTFDIKNINAKKDKEKEKEKIIEKEKITYIKKYNGLSLAGRNEQGIKKINQDTYFIEKNINGVENFNIFGVLDGHGEFGHLASNFVKNYLISQIKNDPYIKTEKDPKKIYSKIISNGYEFIAKIYLDADEEIQHQGFDPSRSGTTCIIIIQLLDHLICANTGDSRAMIVYDKDDNLFNSQIYPLSYDCKPELPNEQKRIIESGGVVEKAYFSDDEDVENSGPYRVWAKGEDYPGLAMSRSIGDMDAKKVGVIPNPQIVEYIINKSSKYFVMGSDGIWEFISNEDCMKISNQFFIRNDSFGLCKELSKKATELWDINDIIRDDITVVVGFF